MDTNHDKVRIRHGRGGILMLLYIGNQEEYGCLQELSDKLRQPICLIPAPDNPMEIISSAKIKYSHYIVNIGSYTNKHRELIYALKKFVGTIEGTLILLAIDMTTETPIICELMYAGFTNIIFGMTEEANSLRPRTKGNEDTLPICTKPSVTEPIVRHAKVMELCQTEPMDIPTRQTELMDTGYIGFDRGDRNKKSSIMTERIRHRKIGFISKRAFIGGGGVLVALLVLVVIYQFQNKNQGQVISAAEEYTLVGNSHSLPKTSDYPHASTTPYMEDELSTAQQALSEHNCTQSPVEEVPTLKPATLKPALTEEEDLLDTAGSSSEVSGKEVKGIDAKVTSELDDENNEQSSPAIRSIQLPSSIRMVTGGNITLEPEYTPTTAKAPLVIWQSSDSKVATVEDGIVTAIKPGCIYITVEDNGGHKAKCQITIADQ